MQPSPGWQDNGRSAMRSAPAGRVSQMQNYAGDKRTERVAAAEPADYWADEPRQPRDWKKIVLIVGLGALSWIATYIGMLELIESNLGELPLIHKAVIGFSVAMLMTMIIWLLDQLFAPLPFTTKVLYVAGYVFLTMISVGFGFGFYWKVLESRSEASRSAESAVGQVQNALYGASTRLDQLTSTLVQLTALSRQKAENERATGKSCPNSRPGDGPRRKLRDDDANRFQFAAEMVKGRTESIKTTMRGLDGDLAKIAKADPSTFNPATGTRNEFMNALSRKLDMTVTGFNAFRTDPQLRQVRADLAERADKSVFPDTKGGTFACPDAQLSTALKGVVRAIDQLPVLEKPQIAAVEGSEATVEAFRRMAASFYGLLTFKMPPSADEQRELQKKAVQSVENPALAARAAAEAQSQAGLSKRDYIPLAIAVFVDLCLLLVSMGRPINRLQGLVPKMREAERGPVIQILSRFSDIHRDEKMRESFEVLRHVVFDYAGAYYVAVPLDAPFTETRMEQLVDPQSRKARLVKRQFVLSPARREALRVEAHLIGNLFASFEKDAVFKRVMWLNTEGARKRLQRQGSKFANAEAFRIYRFNDGAWSEIILGAVMGAARRVEARRGAEAPLARAGRGEPTLDSLFDRMRQAEEDAVLDHELPRAKPMYDRWAPPMAAPAMAADGATATTGKDASAGSTSEADLARRFGPYAARVREETSALASVMSDGEHTADSTGIDHANSNTRTHQPLDQHTAQTAAPATQESLREAILRHTGSGMPDPEAEAGNVVPFKNQPRGAGEGSEPSPAADAPLPSFITRGQTALAAQPHPVEGGAYIAEAQESVVAQAAVRHDDVTVTATERKLTFSVPMNDPRIDKTLYGVAGILQQRIGQAASVPVAGEQAAPALLATTEPEATEPETATAQSVSNAATHPTTTDRPTTLALPSPTMERETRG